MPGRLQEGRVSEYDPNQPVRRHLTPMQVAVLRASRFEDPIYRHTFLEAFKKARVAASLGDPQLYLWYRKALNQDASVVVAGLIEGAASVNDPRGVVL